MEKGAQFETQRRTWPPCINSVNCQFASFDVPGKRNSICNQNRHRGVSSSPFQASWPSSCLREFENSNLVLKRRLPSTFYSASFSFSFLSYYFYIIFRFFLGGERQLERSCPLRVSFSVSLTILSLLYEEERSLPRWL